MLEILTKRSDFIRLSASPYRWVTKGFVLQMQRREPNQNAAAGVRVGLTVSRKVGGAVVRNRAKRRLRELVRLTLADVAKPGYDYVLVARPETTASLPFTELQKELVWAMRKIHTMKPNPKRQA